MPDKQIIELAKIRGISVKQLREEMQLHENRVTDVKNTQEEWKKTRQTDSQFKKNQGQRNFNIFSGERQVKSSRRIPDFRRPET